MFGLLLPAASVSAQSSDFPKLLQGTPVMLILDQTIDSAHAKMGERVAFEVSSDVNIGDRVVIPTGALALGTVIQASHRGWIGRGGRVSVNIDAVRLPGGQVVPLAATPDLEDNGNGTVDDAIATNLVAESTPSHRLIDHRKDTVIREGSIVRAFVRRDTVIVQQTASMSN
jgi:hypothetical protein